MNADELRARQTPIKTRFKEDPASAALLMRAEGRLAVEGQSIRVETPNGPVVAGLHTATGGEPGSACGAEMLLQALVACAGVTLGAVATSMGIVVRSGTVAAEGTLDFRGTLGVSRETPIGFSAITMTYSLDTDAEPAQVDTLLKLTERYCVVFQTLKNPPAFPIVQKVSNAAPAS